MSDSGTRTDLNDFGHLMKMVHAAEDFGLDRGEACAAVEQALELDDPFPESLDQVAASLAARVLEKSRQQA
jgi:hypothetical protein